MVGAFAVVLTSLYATVGDVLRSLPQTWVDEILEEVEEIREEVEEIREGVEDAEADRPQQSYANSSGSSE